ncbi:MAG: phosphatase PAP2 family protein [Bacteroidota bacterium]
MHRLFNLIPSFFSLIRELKNSRIEYFRFIIFLSIAGSVSIIALIIFLDITSRLDQTIWFGFDHYVNTFIHSFRSAELTRLMTLITDLGSLYAYLIIIPLITAALYLNGRTWNRPLQSAIVLISSFLLNAVLKWFIHRPRPIEDQRLVEAHFYSYPSGHAMSATGFYGFLVYLVILYIKNVWLKIIMITILSMLIFGIGISRVYLGVHYPTDVLAGFIAGTFWLLVCIMVFRSVNFYRKNSLDPYSDQ